MIRKSKIKFRSIFQIQICFQPEPLPEILLIANLRHAASRVWACTESEFRFCWTKLGSSDNHYTTAPLHHGATIKLVMVIIKSFYKSHHFFNLHIFGYYFAFPLLTFKHAEYKVLQLTNKAFTKKDIVWEYLHEKWNISLPHFLTISPYISLVHLPNENLYVMSFLIKNGPTPFWMETFLDGSFKFYKYNNFDKALCIMSPWPSSSQANPFVGLSTCLRDQSNSQLSQFPTPYH